MNVIEHSAAMHMALRSPPVAGLRAAVPGDAFDPKPFHELRGEA